MNEPMEYQTLTRLNWHIHSVIGCIAGAVAWRTCGRYCAASGMGATTQRSNIAYNERVHISVGRN